MSGRICYRCKKPETAAGGGTCESCGARNWVAAVQPVESYRPRSAPVAPARVAMAPSTSHPSYPSYPRSSYASDSSVAGALSSASSASSASEFRGSLARAGGHVAPPPRSRDEREEEDDGERGHIEPAHAGDDSPPFRGQLPLKATVERTRYGWMAGSSAGSTIVDDFAGSRINELLGGFMRPAVLLLVGVGGAGKSTAAADLVARACEHWQSRTPPPGIDRDAWRKLRVPDCPFFWLDSDQGDPALVRVLFQRADAEDLFADSANLIEPRIDPWTFEEALAKVPPDARILVIDSLEKWAPRQPKRQAEIMTAMRRHPAWLKIVINGANAEGGNSGEGDIPRAADAVVYAERSRDGRYSLRTDKFRWGPCATWKARHPNGVQGVQETLSEAREARDAEDVPAEDEKPPPSPSVPAPRALRLVAKPPSEVGTLEPPGALPPAPSPATAPVPVLPPAPAPVPASTSASAFPPVPILGAFLPTIAEPNCDEEFLARVAATWDRPMRTAYKARLRLLGVSDEGLREWMELLHDHMRGAAPPRCQGSARVSTTSWCGRRAPYVAESADGTRWYACEGHVSQAPKSTRVEEAEPIRRPCPVGEFPPRDRG